MAGARKAGAVVATFGVEMKQSNDNLWTPSGMKGIPPHCLSRHRARVCPNVQGNLCPTVRSANNDSFDSSNAFLSGSPRVQRRR